jgi:hypothetical protein
MLNIWVLLAVVEYFRTKGFQYFLDWRRVVGDEGRVGVCGSVV